MGKPALFLATLLYSSHFFYLLGETCLSNHLTLFFRRLRQRWLSEQLFTRYLLFAIGEILLVVIGILIALQIDHWNEERKLRRERTEIFDWRFDVKKSEAEVWYSELLNSTIYPLHTKPFRIYYPESCQVFEGAYARPLDYGALCRNEAFKNLLSEIICLRNYSIVINESPEADLQHLIESVEKELGVLRGE